MKRILYAWKKEFAAKKRSRFAGKKNCEKAREIPFDCCCFCSKHLSCTSVTKALKKLLEAVFERVDPVRITWERWLGRIIYYTRDFYNSYLKFILSQITLESQSKQLSNFHHLMTSMQFRNFKNARQIVVIVFPLKTNWSLLMFNF